MFHPRSALLAPVVLLACLATGCFSGQNGPFTVFSSLEGVNRDAVPAELGRIRDGMQQLARSREQSARQSVAFWQGMKQEYGGYMIPAADTAVLVERIDKLSANFRSYRFKRPLCVELQNTAWPYGLKDWRRIAHRGLVASPNRPSGLPPGVSKAQAIAFAPLWVERFSEPQPTVPLDDQPVMVGFLSDLGNNLHDLQTFWISVGIAMAQQEAYAPKMGLDRSARYRDEDLVERETFPLPRTPEILASLVDLDAYFDRFPGYQRERARFQPVEGTQPWLLPKDELFGKYDVWSAILYSSAKGYEWISEATYRGPEQEVTNLRIYHQQGRGHAVLFPVWLPLPLIATGATERHDIVDDKMQAPEKVGGLLAVWPFYLYGDGAFFAADQQRATFFAAGVPLAYAFLRVESETGERFRMHELLNFNLYGGGTYEDPANAKWQRFHSVGPFACLFLSAYGRLPENGYSHLAAWGLLWTAARPADSPAEYNGPLFGMLGWGKDAAGRPLFRLFGIPIPRNE